MFVWIFIAKIKSDLYTYVDVLETFISVRAVANYNDLSSRFVDFMQFHYFRYSW